METRACAREWVQTNSVPRSGTFVVKLTDVRYQNARRLSSRRRTSDFHSFVISSFPVINKAPKNCHNDTFLWTCTITHHLLRFYLYDTLDIIKSEELHDVVQLFAYFISATDYCMLTFNGFFISFAYFFNVACHKLKSGISYLLHAEPK